MRIIRGKYQRRVIHVPVGLPVRPTTDMAKESLFNILENDTDLEGLKVLDLFAGTGNISYEFCSRGCASVLAVDNHPKCTKFIEDTARLLDMQPLRVIRSDVFKFLTNLNTSYDLIFADPPYDMDAALYHELVALIFDRKLLTDDGALVVEHSKKIDFMEHPHLFDLRRYGKVHFSFFSPEIDNTLA